MGVRETEDREPRWEASRRLKLRQIEGMEMMDVPKRHQDGEIYKGWDIR